MANFIIVIDKIELKYFEFNDLVTNFWIIQELLKRNHNVYITTIDKLMIRENKPFALSYTTKIQDTETRKNDLVYEKEIAHYDTYLFAMLAASTQKQTESFRQYLAEAVSSVVPDDAELACACIKRGRTFLEDPVKTIASIKKETFRSDGTAFWPDISEKQIAERMWEAQIKVVFPIIEKQRSIIVERYRKGIEALLPITGAYGEMFFDAEDVEIGVLSHLVSLGRLAVAFEDGKMIARLRNARNTLAHIKPMTQVEIDEIL